ncbi:MAG: SAM-dependent methyltransferase, partial [Waterburya sp.]
LLIEAKPVAMPSEKIHPFEETVEDVANDVQLFSDKITSKLEYWKNYLDDAQAKGEKVVVWGSGSKCVAFLTTLKTIDKIQYAVDINPHRHGKYIPGVGKEIMSPEFLKTYQPDKVIVMNAIYREEISQMLQDMGVSTEVVAL